MQGTRMQVETSTLDTLLKCQLLYSAGFNAVISFR